MMTTTKLSHRITSLERWGMRTHADFQPEAVQRVAEAGFTGVLVNGGSGIGPDMLTPESLVASPVIPDLMPLTVRSNRREMARRCGLLKESGLKPWLCLWGVPGPDDSAGAYTAESNRFFDRRGKLEMAAKLDRTPEIFGHRNPKALSWRGSRPLCVSHPLVRDYYLDLFPRLLETYPDLDGIFFFPGDNEAELCDDHCPRCSQAGFDLWGVMIRYVNQIYAALTAVRPNFNFYFTVWNQDQPRSVETIRRFLAELAPGIGICMSISDNVVQPRKSGPMVFNQPWVNFAEPGERFLETVGAAHAQRRPIMVLGEISQSELWDPVCHNMPNPRKVLDLLRNADRIPGANALCDFWGHRGPFLSHANHAAMQAWVDAPDAEPPRLLRQAAIAHYGLAAAPAELVQEALDCWGRFDHAVDHWALALWTQRFSYAIGRDAARGPLYRALVPANLRAFHQSWSMRLMTNKSIDPDRFLAFQEEDRLLFLAVAEAFDALADRCQSATLPAAALLARREARNIQLAGELLASEGRMFAASTAFTRQDAARLRELIEAELEARDRQLEISARIGWGAGINPILVSEDIHNMRLYLSRDDFPDTPDGCFHFTASPYTV